MTYSNHVCGLLEPSSLEWQTFAGECCWKKIRSKSNSFETQRPKNLPRAQQYCNRCKLLSLPIIESSNWTCSYWLFWGWASEWSRTALWDCYRLYRYIGYRLACYSRWSYETFIPRLFYLLSVVFKLKVSVVNTRNLRRKDSPNTRLKSTGNLNVISRSSGD